MFKKIVLNHNGKDNIDPTRKCRVFAIYVHDQSGRLVAIVPRGAMCVLSVRVLRQWPARPHVARDMSCPQPGSRYVYIKRDDFDYVLRVIPVRTVSQKH